MNYRAFSRCSALLLLLLPAAKADDAPDRRVPRGSVKASSGTTKSPTPGLQMDKLSPGNLQTSGSVTGTATGLSSEAAWQLAFPVKR